MKVFYCPPYIQRIVINSRYNGAFDVKAMVVVPWGKRWRSLIGGHDIKGYGTHNIFNNLSWILPAFYSLSNVILTVG